VNMFAIGHAARNLVAQHTLSADMAAAANIWRLARPPTVPAQSTNTACFLPLLVRPFVRLFWRWRACSIRALSLRGE
jgi:hypothetical protein